MTQMISSYLVKFKKGVSEITVVCDDIKTAMDNACTYRATTEDNVKSVEYQRKLLVVS